MDNKKIGIALLAAGVAFLLLSLAADAIRIGCVPGYGYKQIASTIVGVIAAVVGFVLYSRNINNKKMGIALLVAGAALLLLSLAADAIRIGCVPGYGYKQIASTIVGAIAAVVGFVLYSRK